MASFPSPWERPVSLEKNRVFVIKTSVKGKYQFMKTKTSLKNLIYFGQINFQEEPLQVEFFVLKEMKHEIETLSPLKFWLFFRS